MAGNKEGAVVCFGEILWDILGDKEMPGGAPMNVAYHLRQLGMAPAVITRVGQDERGQKLLQLLRGKQITVDLVQEDTKYATGIVNAFQNEAGEMSYDIVSPAAWDYIEQDDKAAARVSESSFFIFGSLAARHIVSRETLYHLLDAARLKVLDINLRPPHFQPAGIEALLQKADIVKMNHHELEIVSGWWSKESGMQQQMNWLKNYFNLNTVIVTRGGDGAVILEQENFYEHPGYSVQVADTIGSGDAFLAGYLSQRSAGVMTAEALDFACALGALVASRHGAWPEYNLEDINKLRQ